jgi:CBS domain-containing protein
MIVKELMKGDVATGAPDEPLSGVLKKMEARNCGFAPVVDSGGHLVGVITDRDASLAVAHDPQRPASRIAVKEAMSKGVVSCLPDENVKRVLVTMADHHVRRLPVIDSAGHLAGVLSIDDIVAAPSRRGGPTPADIVTAFKGICSPRPVTLI